MPVGEELTEQRRVVEGLGWVDLGKDALAHDKPALARGPSQGDLGSVGEVGVIGDADGDYVNPGAGFTCTDCMVDAAPQDLRALHAELRPGAAPYEPVYFEVEGDMRPRRTEGLAANDAGVLTVRRVVQARAADAGDCRRAAW